MAQRIVVAGFIHSGRKVLLARRAESKRIAPGRYHLPGGHVEFGEDFASALTREILEEFRIDIKVHDPFYLFSYVHEDSHTAGVVCFATAIDSHQPLIFHEHDHSDAMWVQHSDFERYLSKPRDHNYDAVRIGFERLLSGELITG